ncbi:hypothetical protein BC008_42750 [Mastigocoleus testarum BC008]|uniref:Uncharacterized protein n=1 Tax=Mastigocoleus testarum BC008 TaxID=371196 RepID=A0A0V7ZQG3_9CYAN|nr:hypothetical protein BC008_42750 [Mastigocoleus testarum BC008]
MRSIKSYREILYHPLLLDWGWFLAFFLMCVFNGWLLRVAEAGWYLLALFVVFPLFFTFGLVFKNNLTLITSLILPRLLLAVTLCFFVKFSDVQFSGVTPFTSALFCINLIFFGFVVYFVARTRGILVPAVIVTLAIFLWISIGWEVVFDLVWYCNFMITVNKAGRKLRQTFDSFFAAMIALTGSAGLGISLGWIAANFKL